MTKWYPLVILPVVFSYLWHRYRAGAVVLVDAFLGTAVVIVTVTLLTAGLSGFTVPYEFHAACWGNSSTRLVAQAARVC